MLGILRYRVEGKSMDPSLKEGDFVLARRISSPKPGDIVIAESKGMMIIKRIASIEGDIATLVSDNPDARKVYQVKKSSIRGKVIFRVSKGQNK